MKFDFFQFCFTVIMFAAVILLVGGALTNNEDALEAGGMIAFILFWTAYFRCAIF